MDSFYLLNRVKDVTWKYFEPLEYVGGTKHMARAREAEELLQAASVWSFIQFEGDDWVWAMVKTGDKLDDTMVVPVKAPKYQAIANLLDNMHDVLQARAAVLLAHAQLKDKTNRKLTKTCMKVMSGWVDPESRN